MSPVSADGKCSKNAAWVATVLLLQIEGRLKGSEAVRDSAVRFGLADPPAFERGTVAVSADAGTAAIYDEVGLVEALLVQTVPVAAEGGAEV